MNDLMIRKLKYKLTDEKVMLSTFYKDMRNYLADAYNEFERQWLMAEKRDVFP
jgi:hypothetical protein